VFIDESLPAESPYLYGLHPNAEIEFLTTISDNLFRTVLEMQPRESGDTSGMAITREDKVIHCVHVFTCANQKKSLSLIFGLLAYLIVAVFIIDIIVDRGHHSETCRLTQVYNYTPNI